MIILMQMYPTAISKVDLVYSPDLNDVNVPVFTSNNFDNIQYKLTFEQAFREWHLGHGQVYMAKKGPNEVISCLDRYYLSYPRLPK